MNNDSPVEDLSPKDVLRLAVEIVSSYVSNNSVETSELPDLLKSVHQSLANLGQNELPQPAASEKQKPAVSISRSIQDDHIVCLEDGNKLTMLKRYLRSRYNMSPEDYRRKWGLPHDYPMVAPAYASRRSEFAKSIGLGKGVRRRPK